MTLLLDAATVVDLLLRSDRGEQVRAGLAGRDGEEWFSVAHLDAEVFSALTRLHRAGELDGEEITALLHRLATLAARRLPITGQLLLAAWSLRDNVAARDGLYVAAARALAAGIVTTDARLARAVPEIVAELE